MQQIRQVGLCLFVYANDNKGAYPDGKSSTEIFQKLIDANYVTDPTIFYTPLPGKNKPITGQKLKPENVCFDVTSGVDSNAPEHLPIIFVTGYRVTYAPGGAAVPIVNPGVPYHPEPRSWLEWLRGESIQYSPIQTGIFVMYKNNSAAFRSLNTMASPDAAIPNFVPLDFNPGGKTYRQLTPDGPLVGN